jgi:hypothetical protein
MKNESTLRKKAVAAMEKAVARALDEYREAGEAIPVWKNGNVILLESTGDSLVRETQAHYGSKPRGRRTGTHRKRAN